MRTLLGLVVVLISIPALAAGKPHSPYPERLSAPADTADRDAKCETVRSRTDRIGESMKEQGILSRINFLRSYHRAGERYLKEQCGYATDTGLEVSHRAEPSGKVFGAPAAKADEHH